MTAPIVVGLALRDDDAAPLALAIAMARLIGAPLALVSAFETDVLIPAPPPAFTEHLMRGTLDALEKRAGVLRGEYEVSVHARRGSPGRVLHDICAESKPRCSWSAHRIAAAWTGCWPAASPPGCCTAPPARSPSRPGTTRGRGASNASPSRTTGRPRAARRSAPEWRSPCSGAARSTRTPC